MAWILLHILEEGSRVPSLRVGTPGGMEGLESHGPADAGTRSIPRSWRIRLCCDLRPTAYVRPRAERAISAGALPANISRPQRLMMKSRTHGMIDRHFAVRETRR